MGQALQQSSRNQNVYNVLLWSTCVLPHMRIPARTRIWDVPYAYTIRDVPYVYTIWDVHIATRVGQHLFPYKYFICMFYFFTGFDYCCYKSITRDLQMKAPRFKAGSHYNSHYNFKSCAMPGSHTQTGCGLLHIRMHHKVATKSCIVTVG